MLIFVTTSAVFTICNLALRNKKKTKAKKDAQKMFLEHGYYLSDKDANKLMNVFLGKSNIEALDNAFNNYTEMVTQFIPGMNIYYIIQNTLYFSGMKSTQEFYKNYSNWELYDRQLEDGTKPLDNLSKIGLKTINNNDTINNNNIDVTNKNENKINLSNNSFVSEEKQVKKLILENKYLK